MHIAIIGSGNVGGTLGRRWAALGHDVAFGVRHPELGATAVKGGEGDHTLPPRARVTTPTDAVVDGSGRRADVLLLATPWKAVPEALRELDAGALEGIVLVDATNPVAPGLRVDVGPNGASGAERVQALAPATRVVKAFSTTGFENMRNPVYDGVASAMFYAGDDANAKGLVHQLATALGFDAIDAGPLSRARELEHLAVLWISLAMGGTGQPALGRDFAFRVMRR